MADSAVNFLLDNIQQLLLYNPTLVVDVKDQVESLYDDLILFKAFLRDLSAQRNKTETVKAMEKLIRDRVYEAEDILDEFVAEAAIFKSRSGIHKLVYSAEYSQKVRSLGKSIEILREKVKQIYSHKNFGITDVDLKQLRLQERSLTKAPIVEEENVVGFEEAAEHVIGLLMEGSQELEVISIVGMLGLGKTTLAKLIFHHPVIKRSFEYCLWVGVSQEYSRKEVFLQIISLLVPDSDKMHDHLSTESLAMKLSEILAGRRYLIIMDDVWSIDVWNDLRSVVPKNTNWSKILLTTRIKEVAWHANSNTRPYELHFLSHDESWKLLQMKTFGLHKFPAELIKHGMRIAEKCKGLPLGVVVCGEILRKKAPDGRWWEKFAQSENVYFVMNQETPVDRLVALSFDHLPYHLKLCFLYFGMFPNDYQIPVWKLICLWIAEEFVEQRVGVSLEDTARAYLEHLIDMNLVMVGEWTLDRQVKTCHVHDMLYTFCKNRALDEHFFQEISDESPSSSLNTYRRLCIHSHILKYISSKPSVPRVRSFLCFSSEQVTLPLEHISSIPRAFKLLKVLDAKPIYFTRFPSDLTQLLHLRYLVLSISFKILPATISKYLWNLQSLIVETPSHTLEIKGDIWKMIQLRHLKTNVSTFLPSPFSSSRKSIDDSLINSNLQTLSMISPESCTEDVIAKAPNLKKLGIRGHLAKLLDTDGESSLFDSLGKLAYLESLKLLNDVYPPSSEGKLVGLPELYKLPPKLKKITLANTMLDWKHAAILGRVVSLEILKLKDNAFDGESWEPEEGGFPFLKVLYIESTDLVSWKASDRHFPSLRSLYLRECEKLEEVPFGLADIQTLKKMSLDHTTKTAVVSAGKIQDYIEKKGSEIQLFTHRPALLDQ